KHHHSGLAAINIQSLTALSPTLPSLQRSTHLRFLTCSALRSSASDPAAVCMSLLPTLQRSAYLRFRSKSGQHTSASDPAAVYIPPLPTLQRSKKYCFRACSVYSL